jgi:hypothetical protein
MSMAINWKEVISKDFWFDIDRTAIHLSDRAILYGGGAAVMLGIMLFVYKVFTKNLFLKKVTSQLSTIFITIGLLEVIWFALRWQYVSALGTRFVAALIGIAGLVWLYWPIKYLFTRYKTDMAEAQRKMVRDKYLQR